MLGGPVALWRGLRSGPQTPAGLPMASDAPTLCPELRFWVGPLPVPVREIFGLLTSVPALGVDPSLC